jgi:hypothetical protein
VRIDLCVFDGSDDSSDTAELQKLLLVVVHNSSCVSALVVTQE